MSIQENIKLDEQFIAAWSTHDADRAVAVLSDDVMWQDVGSPEPMRGKAAARQFIQSWFTAFPDLKAVVTNRVVSEDRVASETEFTGTNSGPLQLAPSAPAIPATGKKVMGKGTYFLRIQNGKAAEVHSYPDGAGLMMQLGLMPGG